MLSETYVDITNGDDTNDGSSWVNAVQNIYVGINITSENGILHIGFGNYTTQSDIIFTRTILLKYETYLTGGGTGTTIMPQTFTDTIIFEQLNGF